MFLDQRHSLGGVQAGELYRYKAIQRLEALVAADLLPSRVSAISFTTALKIPSSTVSPFSRCVSTHLD
jgi:hypothetical protein